jgi:hypothetical protein
MSLFKSIRLLEEKGVFLCLSLLPFVKEKDAGVCEHCPSWLALTIVLGGLGEVPPAPL